LPLYNFECLSCGSIKEEVFHIDDCPKSILCDCGSQAKKVIMIGHGGLQLDRERNIPWLKSAVKTLQPDCERPITTRTEYNNYIKEKGLIPVG